VRSEAPRSIAANAARAMMTLTIAVIMAGSFQKGRGVGARRPAFAPWSISIRIPMVSGIFPVWLVGGATGRGRTAG
jgi:hypothetical protein